MDERVRYAVVGAGKLAQAAILPAFAQAKANSELVAVISGDEQKRTEITARYGLSHSGSYADYERVLERAGIDAVYISLPNHLHREYTERAARVGVHVICEKPMAMTVEDCEAMLDTAHAEGIRLMIAYRLHFEEANLRAIDTVTSGKLGDVRLFSSVFTQQVRAGDIRTRAPGGGALFDLGTYCVNAARYLFRAEPEDVFAYQVRGIDERSAEVDAMTTVLLRFEGGRHAQFTVNQEAAPASSYRIVGSNGDLRVEPAYTFMEPLVHYLNCEGRLDTTVFPTRDQFAPEIVYFSKCVLDGVEPEPSGREGLADVRVLCAALESAQGGRVVRLGPYPVTRRPTLDQAIFRPAPEAPAETTKAPPPNLS